MFRKIICFAATFVFLVQSNVAQVQPDQNFNEKRADEIIDKARKVIYGELIGEEINVAKLVTSGAAFSMTELEIKGRSPMTNETRESQKNEAIVDFSGLSISRTLVESNNDLLKQRIKTHITIIVNGEKVNIESGGTVNGQKIDINRNRKSLEGIGKQLGINDTDTNTGLPVFSGTKMFSVAVGAFHPILLRRPGLENWRFRYVGRAKADGITADVVEYVSEKPIEGNATSTTRYFFNSENSQLLLITSDSSNDLAETRTSTYYSEHKLMGGLKIPTKIKIEQETVMRKKMKILGMIVTSNMSTKITDLTVDEFEINGNIPPEIFEIKNK